jgi:PadR family transcriptional regulator AphA
MSLKAMVLTALSKEDMTGYEITKGFVQAWGHFWHASHQQVYRELAKMVDKQWVNFVSLEQTDKPDKKVYSLTDKGKVELLAWLEQPCREKRVNDDLLIKFFAGEIISTALLIEETKVLQVSSQQKLTSLMQIEQSVFVDIDQSKSIYAKCAYLSLRKGIINHLATLDWCQEVLSVLKVESF